MSAVLKTAAGRPDAGSQSTSPTDPRIGMGSYRDLFVHLVGTDSDENVLTVAETIASQFDAHVEIMLANAVPSPAVYAAEGVSPMYDLIEAEREGRDETADRLRKRVERLACPFTFRRCDAYPNELERLAASFARCADLTVVARPYSPANHAAGTLETVLFEGAGLVYVVPPEPPKEPSFDTVVVGWSNSPECARAIAAAMPFLQRAHQVFLVSVTEGDATEERRQEPLADMARHLARHDVAVEIRHLPEGGHTADALLNEAKMTGAGLIVSGAYGRSRLREWILGGVTRELLKRSNLPLLLAH